MKTFGIEQPAKTESREDIERQAFEILSSTIGSLENIHDVTRTLRKYAEMIDNSSTKTFIGSFLSNMDEIRSSYQTATSFFDKVSSILEISASPKDNGLKHEINTDKTTRDKKGTGHEGAANTQDPKQKIKEDLLETMNDINDKIDEALSVIRIFKKNNNSRDFIDEACKILRNLDNAIKKLDDIKKDIEEYSRE